MSIVSLLKTDNTPATANRPVCCIDAVSHRLPKSLVCKIPRSHKGVGSYPSFTPWDTEKDTYTVQFDSRHRERSRLNSNVARICKSRLQPCVRAPSALRGEPRSEPGWRCCALSLTRGSQARRDRHRTSAHLSLVRTGTELRNRHRSYEVPSRCCFGSRDLRWLRPPQSQSQSIRARFLYRKNRWTAPRRRQALKPRPTGDPLEHPVRQPN